MGALTPLCVRCASKPAVACVRSPLGHQDAVCYGCCSDADTMLPLVWPAQKLAGELVVGDVVKESDGFMWKVTEVEEISDVRLQLTLEPVFASMTARSPVKQTVRKMARMSMAEGA